MTYATRQFSFARFFGRAIPLISALGGCGLVTPEKYPFLDDTIYPDDGNSQYGIVENAIIGHVQCEISKGIWEVWKSNLIHKKWLYTTDWGTSATITLTFEDQSGVNPGVSLTTPLENSVKTFPVGGNVTSPQSFALGLGGTGTANATRTETIQFTYSNKALLRWAQKQLGRDPATCEKTNTGVLINSDLKIDQFIYDKMSAASNANEVDPEYVNYPPYNTFQEQITFVAALGANATPTWKFARVTANSTSPLATATRTDTDQLTITLGEVQPATPTSPAQLKSAGAAIHQSGVAANQNGTNIKASSGM